MKTEENKTEIGGKLGKIGKRGDEGSNPGGAAAAGRRDPHPLSPRFASLHKATQTDRTQTKFRKTENDGERPCGCESVESVRQGGMGGGGLKLKKNFLAGRQQAGRSLGSLILIRTATWQIDRITSHLVSQLGGGGGGRESNLGGIMHDDRPAWFACLAWLSLVGGGGGGTHSLGQSVGNWRKLGIGGSIGIPENYKAGKRLKS